MTTLEAQKLSYGLIAFRKEVSFLKRQGIELTPAKKHIDGYGR
jgi:hypothetical protein